MSCTAHSALANLPRPIVSVNGVIISNDEIARETQNHPANRPIDAWALAARALVVRELLLERARDLGLGPVPACDAEGRRETDEEALIRGLIETEVATPVPDPATCRRYYERNAARFRSADLFEAAHILISTPRDSPQARALARERVLALLALLAAQPEGFAELAATHSACPSGPVGGNLGQIARGDTAPEFDAALAALEPGEITREPIETRYGLHIIRLDRKIPGRTLPFEMVETRIAEYLSEMSRRTAVAQYLSRLASRSDVVGVDLPTPAELRVF